MYSKTITYPDRILHIYISQKPCFDNEKFVVFGSPINLNNFDLENQDLGNSLKGYWVKIDFKNDSTIITNDILGGFRLYYYANDKTVIVSDDYEYIIEKSKMNSVIEGIEFEYWQKHRFSTGQSTFIKNLKKISPASIFSINNLGIKEKTYFKDVFRESNSLKHKETIHNDLLNTFKEVKENSKPKILLFSGGKDSCLLLQYMLHFNIEFTPIFFKLKPLNKTQLQDVIKVRAVSRELNIKLNEIEIDISKCTKEEKEQIVKKQLFDRHFSLLHYLGHKILKEKFGEDALIINGQSSDSILSFGPSEDSLMSYFRRNIMYFPKSVTSKIGLILLMAKTRKYFKLPKKNLDKLVALFDEFKYTRVLDQGVSESYLDYIKKYVVSKTGNLQSYHSKEMYVKILSFSQGSDNQVVVNSSKLNKINTLMPFATPNIIYNTIKYKDEKLEVKNPKYVIENILEDVFLFHYKKIDIKGVDISDLTVENNNAIATDINTLFVNKAKKILN